MQAIGDSFMAVIDASVWIAWFRGDDKFHSQAKQIIQSVISSQEKISIPVIAFTEVGGVVKRTTQNMDDAWDAIRCMKKMKPEVFADFGKLEPIATKIAINHSIRGADAYYVVVAEITRTKLFTFDKLQKDAFDAISDVW